MFLTVLGMGCLGAAGVEVCRLRYGNDVKGRLTQALYEAELYNQHRKNDGKKVIQKCKVTTFYKEDYGYDISLRLPVGLTVSDVKSKIEVLEMSLDAEILIESNGQYVHLKIGKLPLSARMNYKDKLVKRKGIYIPLFTRFGTELIDMQSEIGCHILIGGASGMGKSKLLDLILTLIITQSEGKAKIALINNKLVDTFLFRNLPNVKICETLMEAEVELDRAIEEIERRKRLMVKEGVVKATNYTLEHLAPYFVVIDEYARFSDSKDFQTKVIEIAERGRSFDIHLVLATQRPDAKEVLNPRIKANCMTKIALKTTTSSNSRVILESDDAFLLPEIQGRAILQKSGNKTIQVPFLSSEQQAIMLQPYFVKAGSLHDQTRLKVVELPREVPSAKPRSNRKPGLQRYNESLRNGKPDL